MGDVKMIMKSIVIGSAIHQFIGELVSTGDAYRRWYDVWNNIFVFPPEYTDLIDMLLIMDKKAIIGTKIVKPTGQYVPGIGSHKLYWEHSWSVDYWNYIVFVKMDKEDDIFYVCYSTSRQMSVFEDAVRRIFEPAKDMIRTISIDSSRGSPFPMFLDKTFDKERKHQENAIDMIIDGWFEGKVKNNNRKVMICGKRGSGKSYIARLLSKRMETKSKSITVRLYDDFNPSLPGVSIALLVLQYAKVGTPVILLIDEIDKHYKRAIDGKHADRTNLLVHTRDISSLNKMLDMIADTKNIITIFTTEKSPETLYKNKKYHSFMRKGRVDEFIHFTIKNNNYVCEKLNHTDITGYDDMNPDSDSESESEDEKNDETEPD